MPFIYINNCSGGTERVVVQLISKAEDIDQKGGTGELHLFADKFNEYNELSIKVEKTAMTTVNIFSCIYNASQKRDLFGDDYDLDVLFILAVKHLQSSFYNSVSSIVLKAKSFLLTDDCLDDTDVNIKCTQMSSLSALDKPIYGNEEVLNSFMIDEYSVCSNVFLSSSSNKVDKTEIENLYLPTVANYVFIEFIIQQLNVFIKDHSDNFSCIEIGDDNESGLESYFKRLLNSIHSRMEVSGVNTLLKEEAAKLYFSKPINFEKLIFPLRYWIPKTDKDNPTRKICFSIIFIYLCMCIYLFL